MTEADFDGESVLRFFMTNFDVEDEDNKIGKQTVFSTKGNNQKILHDVPPADATALSHLHDACKSVLSRKNPKAAILVANFMKLSGCMVHQLSCKEQVQETVLEAVMEVAIRKDCFNLYTRETVLKAAMESALFTNRQRERLMERLAKTWGEAIWSTENGLWNCPINDFKNNDTTHKASAPAPESVKFNSFADNGFDITSAPSSMNEARDEYSHLANEEVENGTIYTEICDSS